MSQPHGQPQGQQSISDQDEQVHGVSFSRGTRIGTYAVLVAALNSLLLYSSPEDAPGWRLMFASGILWLSALPALMYTLRAERRIPYLPAMTTIFFVYYGLPAFLGTIIVRGRIYDFSSVTDAVGLALLGEALLLLVFYTPLGRPADFAPRIVLDFDMAPAVRPLLVLGAGGMLVTGWAMYGDVPIRVAAVVAAFSRLPLLVLCGMFLLHLRDELTPGETLVSGTLFLSYLLLALGKGALAQVMYAVAPMFLLYVWERGKVPYKSAALAILLVIPFMHTKIQYRYELERQQLGVVDRIRTFVNITYDGVVNGGADFARDAARTSNERTSHLGTFSYVVRETPRRVPYWEGETYRMIPWGFVPRLFAPDKPTRSLGQLFGHRYGLLDARDYRTAFNCPQLIEMFINFGEWGVIVGMTIVGLYYRAIYRMLNYDGASDAIRMLGAVTFTALLNIESDASLVLVGAPQSALIGYFFLLVCAYFSRMLYGVAGDDDAPQGLGDVRNRSGVRLSSR